jgi:hypothetical protein
MLMPSVIMPSVTNNTIMLKVVMLSVVMLNDMLSVVAPFTCIRYLWINRIINKEYNLKELAFAKSPLPLVNAAQVCWKKFKSL